jgi:hypothetical protein
MLRKTITATLLFLFSFFNIVEAISIEKQRFGLNTAIKSRCFKEKVEEPNRSYDKGYVYQAGLNYNLLMNKWLYLGFDLSGTGGESTYRGYDSTNQYGSKTENSFLNTEIRAGYYFLKDDYVLIPFIGYGYHKWKRTTAPHEGLEQKLEYSLPYATAGLRYTLLLGELTTMGVKVQIAKSLSPKVKNHSQSLTLELGNTIITEIEAPISYSNPSIFEGNLALIPFFHFVNSKKSSVKSGYSHETSKSVEKGLRVEYFYTL